MRRINAARRFCTHLRGDGLHAVQDAVGISGSLYRNSWLGSMNDGADQSSYPAEISTSCVYTGRSLLHRPVNDERR